MAKSPNTKPTSLACRARLLLAAALLLMTITGCAKSSAPPPLAVEIPADCDHLTEPVTPPSIVPKEDLGVRSAKFAAALGQANGRLEKAKLCNEKVREAFNKGT